MPALVHAPADCSSVPSQILTNRMHRSAVISVATNCDRRPAARLITVSVDDGLDDGHMGRSELEQEYSQHSRCDPHGVIPIRYYLIPASKSC